MKPRNWNGHRAAEVRSPGEPPPSFVVASEPYVPRLASDPALVRRTLIARGLLVPREAVEARSSVPWSNPCGFPVLRLQGTQAEREALSRPDDWRPSREE